MKKVAVLALLVMLTLSGCQRGTPQIIISEEPCVLEVASQVFSFSLLEDYVSATNGSGKKIAFEDISFIGTVNAAQVGVYPIIVKVSDRHQEVEEVINVHVVDTEKPTLKIVPDEILFLINQESDLNPSNHGISAYDTYDGLITERISFVSDLDLTTVGTYDVVYEVSDTSGNKVEVSLKARVTSSFDEYAKYLYKRSVDFYWGNYFLVVDNKIVNFEDSFDFLFTNELKRELQKDLIVAESEGAALPIRVEYILPDKYRLYNTDYVRNINYINTKLAVSNDYGTRVIYDAIASYNVNKDTQETVEYYFRVKLIDGKWYVDSFTLPN